MTLKPSRPLIALAVMGLAGLSLVKASEGLRTTTYLDPVGIPTVCYGHTGPEVRLGQRYTPAQCEALLAKSLAEHDAGLRRCINVPLNQNQHDAVLSLAYNIGVTKTCKSTLVRKLNAKDYAGAAAEFPKWANASVNGKLVQLPGLVKRRTAERELFLTVSAPARANLVSEALRGIWRTPA